MNNKRSGTAFEREFAEQLATDGFWVHCFQDNQNGQPCDVIAARNGYTWLFDCKNCEGNYFLLSRVEENQYNAMKLFEMTGNSRGMFAIRFPGDKICLVPYWQLAILRKKGEKRLDRISCVLYGEEFSRWVLKRNQIEGRKEEHGNQDWK